MTQGSPPAVEGSTPNVAHVWNHGAYGIGRLQLVSDACASSVYAYVVMGLGEHSSISGWRALYVYLGSEKLVEYRSNATRFFHNDHLGTTKAVTNNIGSIVERWDHFPFGEEWVSGPTGDRYRYTGHLRDQETGNDYAGARYYANARRTGDLGTDQGGKPSKATRASRANPHPESPGPDRRRASRMQAVIDCVLIPEGRFGHLCGRGFGRQDGKTNPGASIPLVARRASQVDDTG